MCTVLLQVLCIYLSFTPHNFTVVGTIIIIIPILQIRNWGISNLSLVLVSLSPHFTDKETETQITCPRLYN